MNKYSLISVVIPTHNRLLGLTESIRSLARQTRQNFEVIVVDDGSEPRVDESVFASLSPMVNRVLLRNEIACGGNYARNRGIERASSPYIAFLDDDDRFRPNKMAVISAAIIENKKVDVFYHPANIIMKKEGVSYTSRPSRFLPGDDIFRMMLIKNHIGGTPMVVCKKNSVMSVGLFDERLPARQDYELWLRLAKAGFLFNVIDEPLTDYTHDTSEGSITRQFEKVKVAKKMIREKYADDYATLDRLELQDMEAGEFLSDIKRFHLNGSWFSAFKYSIDGACRFKRPIFIAAMFLSLAGSRIFFKVTSKIRGSF